MSDHHAALEVGRADVSATRIVTEDPAPLAPGQVRVRVDRFALTANNVTYATLGDMLGYWGFFPTDDPTWGRVPAMGWGDVIASHVDGITEGTRLYGWFPMAGHVDLTASPTATGLRDDGAHRSEHAAVYRAFLDAAHDDVHHDDGEHEDRLSLLRGLFLTGLLADERFADDGYRGAASVVVLSASSKTAIGFAQRATGRGLDAVVGVTSARNVDFVSSLGCYDEVVTYDDLESSVPPDRTAVSIDMAGDAGVLARLHAHLGDRLLASLIVGRSHHDAPPATGGEMAGPTPELFFAPTDVPRRVEEWGAEGYRERTATALRDFVEGSRSWLTVDRRTGPAAAEQAWGETVAGAVPPDTGLIVSLHD